ncbi:M23 family metallopeptidase [Brachyspira pilosicoli]|uniref:M23 family metallopeptidase n=1 Tax=Brachyspira pilosicoli TaxID=52584 RepID=UPI003AB088FC
MQETSKDKSKVANKFVNNFKSNNKKQAAKYPKYYNKKTTYKKNHNKLYHLKISISKIYDSTLPIRNFFNKIISAIMKKGNHERSILIFYNNEEKGLSLPINNFMILFFVLIFASLIYTGFDAYYKQKEARDFYNTLSATEAKTYSLITEYKDSLNRYSKSLKDYNDTIKNISYLIDYNNNSSFNNNSNNDNDINKTLNEIDRYQKNILTFMDVSSIIHKEIPVGWPVAGGGRISSGFGARLSPFTQEKSYHYGVDIAGPYGTPILAAADGKVVFAGWKNGYGWFVLIEHANGYQTGYGHNSELLVHGGQQVKRGQKIAMIGNTGRTTGIHCHFEVRISGDHKNPMPYLNARF